MPVVAEEGEAVGPEPVRRADDIEVAGEQAGEQQGGDGQGSLRASSRG